jgi:hypothetical protein
VTRRLGDFADRGIHTRRGNAVTPIPTPSLALLRCAHCRRPGVTVTAMDGPRLLGWCGMAEAVLDGLRLPGRVS